MLTSYWVQVTIWLMVASAMIERAEGQPYYDRRRRINRRLQMKHPGSFLIWNYKGRTRKPAVTDPPVAPVGNPVNPPDTSLDSPDISGFLTSQCPSGNTALTMDGLFSGMFMNDSEADSFVAAEKAKLKTKRRKSTRYIHHDRISKVIGQITPLSATHDNSVDTCCVTESRLTSPKTAVVDKKTLPLVRLSNSYQFIEQGICKNAGARCRGTGQCQQITKTAFVLLYDPQINLSPPVRFAGIDIFSHCECVNVGT